MARAACKGAQNAQSLTSGDACRNNMKALEFVMSSADWFLLPKRFRKDVVDRAMAADEAYIECCREFCETYENILDEIDRAQERIAEEQSQAEAKVG